MSVKINCGVGGSEAYLDNEEERIKFFLDCDAGCLIVIKKRFASGITSETIHKIYSPGAWVDASLCES